MRQALLSALAFSLMGLFVKVAGRRLPSQEIVLVRALVSLVLSLAWLRRARLSPWGERRGLLLLRGLVGFCGLSCFYFALTRLPLAEATVLQQVHPVFTTVLAALLLGERLRARLPVSIAISLAGVLLITRPALLFGAAPAPPLLPVLIGLAGALFAAGSYVIVRDLARSEHPLVIVFYFPLVAVPASLPVLWRDALWPRPGEWLVLLAVGVCTQVGQVALTRALERESAGRVSALSLLQVVLAALWGLAFLGERPDLVAASGGVLVLLGSWLAAVEAGPDAGRVAVGSRALAASEARTEVVIEVPKWSFVKRSGAAAVDFVSPVPCPFNYGFLPGTLGLDGQPRDALVLGPRLSRGVRVELPVRGSVRFVDAGVDDDKLVCSSRPLSASDRLRIRAFFAVYVLAKRLVHRIRGEPGPTLCLGLRDASEPRA